MNNLSHVIHNQCLAWECSNNVLEIDTHFLWIMNRLGFKFYLGGGV